MNTLILDPLKIDSRLAARWDALLAEQPVHSPFLSRQYAQACASARTDVRVAVFMQEAQAQAFFPFEPVSAARRMLGSARPVGGNFSDYVGLVAAAGFSIEPPALLRACGLHSLLFTHLDESQRAFGLSGEQPARGLRIRKEAERSFIEALFERDKKFAQDTERRRNKLIRDHGALRFALETPESGSLDWLIAQKVAQYERTGQHQYPFSSAADRALLHALAAQDDSLCRPRLTVLYCGERRIAAHFGLQCLDTLAYWFPVYDSSLHSYSPGRLLLWETLQQADALGIQCIDRGEGDSQAKRDFANEEHIYMRGYYSRQTPQALADRALNALRWRLQAWQAKKKED